MTLKELEARLQAVEAELTQLKAQQTSAATSQSWLDLYGRYADDPTFEEAMRLGREYREQVNRQSLEELDREIAEAKAKKKVKKKATKGRGQNARS